MEVLPEEVDVGQADAEVAVEVVITVEVVIPVEVGQHVVVDRPVVVVEAVVEVEAEGVEEAGFNMEFPFFPWWSDYMYSFPATRYSGTSMGYLLIRVVYVILLSCVASAGSAVLEYVVLISDE
jgi:hypothetical protein